MYVKSIHVRYLHLVTQLFFSLLANANITHIPIKVSVVRITKQMAAFIFSDIFVFQEVIVYT